jgi:hypothetical protein
MAHERKPGWGWKLFAGLMAVMVAIGDLPKLLHPIGATALLVVGLNVAAMTGLAAYAFGRRVGPTAFWRGFGPFFCLVTVAQLGAALPILVRLLVFAQGSPGIVLGLLIAVVPVLAMALFTCLALLRQGELLGPGRRPLGRSPDRLPLPLPDPA